MIALCKCIGENTREAGELCKLKINIGTITNGRRWVNSTFRLKMKRFVIVKAVK